MSDLTSSSTPLFVPELLAPGGTFQKAKLALDFGADAVYCGTNIFALRQHKGNFNYETLKEIVDYAHSQGKKVYVTVNVFAHNHHIKVITKALVKLQEIKPDALIVSDAGVFMLSREHAPELAIHMSTQASVTNSLGVKFWANQGAERIIVARELSLREISEIHEEFPDIELEAFIHGAQCMAYSGRCMLSSYMTDSKKANVGSCANSCRWKYKEVTEAKRPDDPIRIEEDEHGTYIFNANDMCMIEHLPELSAAGIVSLKVEGRGRSEFYVTRIVKAYREALNLINDSSEAAQTRIKELKLLLDSNASRPFDTGFFFGQPKQTTNERTTKPTHIFVGIVQEVLDGNRARVLVKNELYKGETVHVTTPDDDYTIVMDSIHVVAKLESTKAVDATTDDANEVSSMPATTPQDLTTTEVDSAHGGKQDEIIITFPQPVPVQTILWLDTAQRASSNTPADQIAE